MSAPQIEFMLRDMRMARWDLEAAIRSAREMGAENMANCLERMQATIGEMMIGLEKCGTR